MSKRILIIAVLALLLSNISLYRIPHPLPQSVTMTSLARTASGDVPARLEQRFQDSDGVTMTQTLSTDRVLLSVVDKLPAAPYPATGTGIHYVFPAKPEPRSYPLFDAFANAYSPADFVAETDPHAMLFRQSIESEEIDDPVGTNPNYSARREVLVDSLSGIHLNERVTIRLTDPTNAVLFDATFEWDDAAKEQARQQTESILVKHRTAEIASLFIRLLGFALLFWGLWKARWR